MKIDYTEKETLEIAIQLPASKSISNRALILQALCKEELIIKNLSDAKDTDILQSNLKNKSFKKHVGMAGTAARFLTAYLATQQTDYFVNADERMCKRPMKELFDALILLGCKIEYGLTVGNLPVKINGENTKGGSVEIASNVSSQFISALMMIAPVLAGGLEIILKGETTSEPYILLTKQMMEAQGIGLNYSKESIKIEEQKYHNNSIQIESDWSSASYFYSALALMDKGSILLKNMTINSLQGDAIVAEIYHSLGVKTFAKEDDILIEKSENYVHFLQYDFTSCPDLAQTVICTCVGLGIEGKFYGLHTLYLKETDRVLALQNELKQFNYLIEKDADEFYHLSKILDAAPIKNLNIKTYHDHRMAMAFAPLSIVFGQMEIENSAVVQKSFPTFWNEIKKIGIA